MKNKNNLHGIWIPMELLMDSKLSKTAIILLSDMAYFNEYYKSRKEISKILKIKENHITTILSELEESGFIEEVGKVFNKRVFALTDMAREYYDKPKKKKKTEKPKNAVDVIEPEEALINETHEMLGGKKRILITAKRMSRMRARLRNFSRDEILRAAYNLSQSDFHMGNNETGVKYATVDFLIRSDEQIEKWSQMEISDKKKEAIMNNLWLSG